MKAENRMDGARWIIRPAEGDEPEWCARLMSDNDPWITLGRDFEQCRKRCRQSGWELLVAASAEGGALGGFLLLDPQGVIGYPYIASIAVVREVRNQGLGRLLIREVEEKYRPTRKFLFLCVSSFNERARSLYLRLGFRTIGVLEDFVISGLDEWLLCKRLQD